MYKSLYVCWNCCLNYLVTCWLMLEQTWILPEARRSCCHNICKRNTSKKCSCWLWWTDCTFIWSMLLVTLLTLQNFSEIVYVLTWSNLILQLSVTIDDPGQDAYHYQPRLFGKVIHVIKSLLLCAWKYTQFLEYHLQITIDIIFQLCHDLRCCFICLRLYACSTIM